jgi:Lrp/AsnC family transcriptional regulator
MKLDKIDRKLIRLLQEDAKQNIKELASKLNMTKTPIYERIRRLEANGIIKKYVALINSKEVASSITVFCSVSLDVQKIEELHQFNEAISKVEEVVECYLMGGAFDYQLKVIVKDLEAYHHFSSGILASLPNVSQIKSAFVLNEVKHTTIFPGGNKI